MVPTGCLCRGIVAISLATFLLQPTLDAAETISNEKHGFRLTVPEGFVPDPELAAASPDMIYAFVRGDRTDDEPDTVLFIESLGGTIGRDRLNPDELPAEFQGRLFTAEWQGFEVDGLLMPEKLGEVDLQTYNVQIPLKRAAIQVRLTGPAEGEAELRSLLDQTLVGLEGESNWQSSALPSKGAASSSNYGSLLLIVAILIVVGGLVALWLVSRRVPKGVTLGIAAAIYFVGMTLASIRVREVVMLSGALKMLGFAGGILGIVDLLRSRADRKKELP